jgi:hypothetical protein
MPNTVRFRHRSDEDRNHLLLFTFHPTKDIPKSHVRHLVCNCRVVDLRHFCAHPPVQTDIRGLGFRRSRILHRLHGLSVRKLSRQCLH